MESEQQKQPKKEGKKILMAILLLVVVGVAGFLADKFNGANGDKVNFDLYVMSKCPYGSQAEGLVAGVMDGFEDYVNFNVEYIASLNDDGTFSSLHGETEVAGNKYQLCVKEYYPEKFWDYVTCQNKDYNDLAASFESCANENDIVFTKIKSCAEGSEGSKLLEESLSKAKSLQVSASPTYYISDEKYIGPKNEVALRRALCERIDNEAKACAELPADKEFTAYVVNDSRCTGAECDVTSLMNQLDSTFTKINYEEVDYATDEGKEFYNKYNLTYLPAVLFTADVEGADSYGDVQPYLQQTEDLYSLAIGAIHDPKKEICYNGVDDTGNGDVDCADADCADTLECREEIVGRLDIFVMSQCPYGTQALNAMEEVFDNFGDNVDFHVNYIASENEDGTFESLHGQEEVDENIRELCAAKYYPEKYMDYIWCRNEDITGSADKCMTNFPKIQSCFDSGEGAKLHSENIKLAESLQIGASPTWMVNNRYVFNGIDAETVRANFCQHNDVEGCENVLETITNTTSSGSCN